MNSNGFHILEATFLAMPGAPTLPVPADSHRNYISSISVFCLPAVHSMRTNPLRLNKYELSHQIP